MPLIRPFRALRFDPEVVGDLGAIVSPPYDVISADRQRDLLARHPKNVIRLELPTEEPGDQPEDRYRRAARTFAALRSDGSLRKDARPSIYVYEQTYRVADDRPSRTQRGFFARLQLEPLEPGSGVLPHERTLAGPREDRYKLLRATGANMSPVVGLYEDPAAGSSARLDALTVGPPTSDVVDDEGTRHRLWAVSADGPSVVDVEALLAVASRGPVTIADGHHRYETALRYRAERRSAGGCEEDPPFDYILALLLATTEPLTVLPTHRVVTDLPEELASPAAAEKLFDVHPVDAARDLVERFGPAGAGRGSAGRLGFWTAAGGAILEARPEAFEPIIGDIGEAVGRLDVTRLQVALANIWGIDAEAVASGRIRYTKDAGEAIGRVDRGEASAAFLLEPTPVADVVAVALAGDVMPQKSTYFFPKALTGLLINPHEW